MKSLQNLMDDYEYHMTTIRTYHSKFGTFHNFKTYFLVSLTIGSINFFVLAITTFLFFTTNYKFSVFNIFTFINFVSFIFFSIKIIESKPLFVFKHIFFNQKRAENEIIHFLYRTPTVVQNFFNSGLEKNIDLQLMKLFADKIEHKNLSFDDFKYIYSKIFNYEVPQPSLYKKLLEDGLNHNNEEVQFFEKNKTNS